MQDIGWMAKHRKTLFYDYRASNWITKKTDEFRYNIKTQQRHTSLRPFLVHDPVSTLPAPNGFSRFYLVTSSAV